MSVPLDTGCGCEKHEVEKNWTQFSRKQHVEIFVCEGENICGKTKHYLLDQVARRKGGVKRDEEQRSRRKRIEEQQETIGLLKRLHLGFGIVYLEFGTVYLGSCLLFIVLGTWVGVSRNSRDIQILHHE